MLLDDIMMVCSDGALDADGKIRRINHLVQQWMAVDENVMHNESDAMCERAVRMLFPNT
jgi:hypothetical protein